jgi:hypothetical protein
MNITHKNLDRLTDFLTSELEQPALAAQIPNGAYIFHGAYDDRALTEANLKMASATLIGMALGLREEAPLVMIFEAKAGEHVLIDLSTEERKGKVRRLAEEFQEQHQQEVLMEINELIAG